MNIKPLLEEFTGYIPLTFSGEKTDIPIFSFPLKNDEFKALRPNMLLRFIAVPSTKDVYIFDGSKIIHDNVVGKFGIPKDYSEIFTGSASFKDGKIIYIRSDRWIAQNNYNSGKIEKQKLKKYDWSFVDKYIDGASDGIKKALGGNK